MNRIVLDTETTNSLEEPIAYDFGWAVVDDDFNVLTAKSYAVAEVILDKDLMSSAYYAEKLPKYFADIANGNRKLARMATIAKDFRSDIAKYGVTEIYAHNARFDDLSSKLTERYLSASKYRYFLPFGVTLCDTLKMARATFGKDTDYLAFCETNGYMTNHKKPRARLTAEIIYRYITDNHEFTEEHQGLADVLIEKEILKECLSRGCAAMALWGN